MKLLHLYQSPSFSGAEAYALEVAEYHAQTSHHEVTFLAKAGSPLQERLHSKTKFSSSEKSSPLKLITSLREVNLADFDAIILHSTQELKYHWPALAFAKLKAKLTGTKSPKVILYTHIWISHSKKDPLHALPYAVLDRVWCSSQKSKEALERFLPVPAKKIEVVRYGRHTDQFLRNLLSQAEARKKLGIPEDATVVGTMSRVDKGKGSRELFEAVTDVMQSRADLHFLMIGPPTDGDPRATELDQELTASLEAMNPAIRSRVHKVGRLEGGSKYLAAFDLFILATYKENFALTLLESLLAKVPCLATDSGGSPDIIRPHTTGWLFLPESTDSLRSTLLMALDQKEKWSDFGANGHRLVAQDFDFKNVMLELDRELLKA